MEERLSRLEEVVVKLREDVSSLKALFSEVGLRLNHLEEDVRELRADIKALNNRIDTDIKALNGRIDSLFRWTVGMILGMWVTVMMTLIPILLKILGAI